MEILQFLNANEGVSVFVAAALAVIALLQNASTTKASNQPFISAALERSPESDTQSLIITNTGKSPAQDVEVTFDPPMPVEDEGQRRMGPFIAKRYAERIPTLVPGTRLSNVYAWRREDQESTYGTPEQVTVTITYRGLGPLKRLKSRYHLDVELLRNETVSLASDSTRGLMTDYRKQLRSVARSLERLSRDSSERAVRNLPGTDNVHNALETAAPSPSDQHPRTDRARVRSGPGGGALNALVQQWLDQVRSVKRTPIDSE